MSRATRMIKQKVIKQAPVENVPDEYVFYLSDGRVLRNLQELKDAFGTMSDETYGYHANSEKNDFANWIRDVLKDNRLADEIAGARNRGEAAGVISRRLG